MPETSSTASVNGANRHLTPEFATSIPPHDPDAEKALLGAMLLSPTAAAIGIEVCTAADFHQPSHGYIFAAIMELSERDAAIDAVTVADELKQLGLLEQVGDPSIFISLQVNTPRIDNAGQYARIVRKHSVNREVIRIASDLRQAGYDGNAELQRKLVTLLTGIDSVPDVGDQGIVAVNWEGLFAGEDQATGEWLVEPVIPSGRQVALYGDAKAGKSLLALDLAAGLASGRGVLRRRAGEPIAVLYLDQEMSRDDLRDRLASMGYEAVDLSHLAYYQLQELPPLDSVAGGMVVTELLDRHHPELVVVDTTASLVAGAEDKADTIRDFYRFTGRPIKGHGVALLRLDHTGKDSGVGQRGTSHKAGDVDIVLAMTTKEAHVTLRCTHSRVPWMPHSIVLRREEEPALSHVLSDPDAVYSGKAMTIARLLDELEVPIDATKRQAMDALRSAGTGRRDADVLAALSLRKERQ